MTAGLLAALMLPVEATNKSSMVVQRRAERVDQSQEYIQKMEVLETETWAQDKIDANLRRQVPVADVLGYLALHEGVNGKLETFRQQIAPVVKELETLAANRSQFVGMGFPAKVRRATDKLRSQLYGAIDEVYGSGVRQKVRAYLQDQEEAPEREYFLLGNVRY